MSYKIIITGVTGMAGEGVLLECLSHPEILEILAVSRKPIGKSHPKLKEYLIPDFLQLPDDDNRLMGYDACSFWAGISSIGMKEPVYSRITYDTTIHFARAILKQNPGMTFIYISGAGTDSSEKGRVMWARVKGKTENALTKMGFKKVYIFRPGFMKLTAGQKNALPMYKYVGWMYPFFKFILPNSTSTLAQVGRAMINSLITGSEKTILEVRDINKMGDELT